jgi:hypothetical protein
LENPLRGFASLAAGQPTPPPCGKAWQGMDTGTLSSRHHSPDLDLSGEQSAQLERRCLYRGVFTSVGALRQESRRFIAAHNRESAKPFVWTKTAESILDAVAHARQAQWHAN